MVRPPASKSKRMLGLALLIMLALGGVGAAVAYTLGRHPPPQLPAPQKPQPLEFFFNESCRVRFYKLQFLDAVGNVIQTWVFNSSILPYLGRNFEKVVYTGYDDAFRDGTPYCIASGNCSLKIVPPEGTHFIRLIAARSPVNYETWHMSWVDLLKNAVRVGLKVNGTITDSGYGPKESVDLTKCISYRPWICYLVVKPNVDSDKDGIPNCERVGNLWMALDPNPRIPEPKPVKTKDDVDIAVYFLTSWGANGPEYGTPRSSDWSLGSLLHPLLGNYSSNDPDVADWHIKWMVEHGVKIFVNIFNIYPRSAPQSFFEDGFLRSRFLKRVRFCTLYEPYGAPEDNIHEKICKATKPAIDYICRNYFKHPQYLKIEEKPILIIQHCTYYYGLFGKKNMTELMSLILDRIRSNGYDIFLVGNVIEDNYHGRDNAALVKPFDAVTSYVIAHVLGYDWPKDEKGRLIVVAPYDDMVDGYVKECRFWSSIAHRYGVKFIPPLALGFDNSVPYEKIEEEWALIKFYDSTPEKFKDMCKKLKEFIDPEVKMVVIYALNEFHEGTALEPTYEYGFGYLDVLREVFCEEPPEGWPPNVYPAEDGIKIYPS